MKPQEESLLTHELALWGKHAKGKGREEDEGLVMQVALLLFLRWPWASDTFCAVPTTLSPMSTQPNVPQDRHIEILGRSLACRGPDGQLPFDLPQDRAEASLADPDNRRFWGVMRGTPEIFWESLREIAVMLHSGN
ncbi:hypothetical protein QC762_0014380 [Podospora pseudocomata]|uniref:Uncharacterized protein n=1 Tax=Podospora pseudocomata TaxID=2093779 RepID=A0ABR0GWE1_9PEZI|nr:hypothetical protein QC762_0014380 [Podospora pseudocomata]